MAGWREACVGVSSLTHASRHPAIAVAVDRAVVVSLSGVWVIVPQLHHRPSRCRAIGWARKHRHTERPRRSSRVNQSKLFVSRRQRHEPVTAAARRWVKLRAPGSAPQRCWRPPAWRPRRTLPHQPAPRASASRSHPSGRYDRLNLLSHRSNIPRHSPTLLQVATCEWTQGLAPRKG